MQGDALPLALLTGPEPRPFVGRLVLERETADVLLEARRRRDLLDDQDELRETDAAHDRCPSYMPNSSRRTFEISPMVTRARRASRIGTMRLPSPSAVSRTDSTARAASSAFRSARTCAVRSSCLCSAAGSKRYSSIGSSCP